MKTKPKKEGDSFADVVLEDYQTQLKALLKCEDEIMMNAGLIFPAIGYVKDAIDETLEAMKSQALVMMGLDSEVEKLFKNSRTNHAWNWMEEFIEWRKERKGVLNFNRKESYSKIT